MADRGISEGRGWDKNRSMTVPARIGARTIRERFVELDRFREMELGFGKSLLQ